jgi:hypothetical protein
MPKNSGRGKEIGVHNILKDFASAVASKALENRRAEEKNEKKSLF